MYTYVYKAKLQVPRQLKQQQPLLSLSLSGLPPKKKPKYYYPSVSDGSCGRHPLLFREASDTQGRNSGGKKERSIHNTVKHCTSCYNPFCHCAHTHSTLSPRNSRQNKSIGRPDTS